MSGAPSLSDLQAAAERAVAMIDAGQVLVLWERGSEPSATFTVVRDGRAGEARTTGIEDEDLRRAAKQARLRAEQPRALPAPPLPPPQPARPHDAFDPRSLDAMPGTEHRDGLEVTTTISAARIAVASTTGVRAAEQRSSFEVVVSGDRVRVTRAAVGPVDAGEAIAEAAELLDAGESGEPWTGGPFILGHEAVAFVLDRLRPAFGVDAAMNAGPLAGRRGTRVAAASVNLSDSPRYPGTLARSFDAEGVPRQPVPLIQDGVAHRTVLDSAAAATQSEASTGHATRPLTLAPYPEHLVLAGGGAEDVAALGDGLYIPAFGRDADGSVVALGARVELDPLAVLASVEALTARQRLVLLRGHAPGGAGAAIVPALRAGAGVRLAR